MLSSAKFFALTSFILMAGSARAETKIEEIKRDRFFVFQDKKQVEFFVDPASVVIKVYPDKNELCTINLKNFENFKGNEDDHIRCEKGSFQRQTAVYEAQDSFSVQLKNAVLTVNNAKMDNMTFTLNFPNKVCVFSIGPSVDDKNVRKFSNSKTKCTL